MNHRNQSLFSDNLRLFSVIYVPLIMFPATDSDDCSNGGGTDGCPQADGGGSYYSTFGFLYNL